MKIVSNAQELIAFLSLSDDMLVTKTKDEYRAIVIVVDTNGSYVDSCALHGSFFPPLLDASWLSVSSIISELRQIKIDSLLS